MIVSNIVTKVSYISCRGFPIVQLFRRLRSITMNPDPTVHIRAVLDQGVDEAEVLSQDGVVQGRVATIVFGVGFCICEAVHAVTFLPDKTYDWVPL